MKNKLAFILILVVFTQCKKEDKYTNVQIFGHAGAGMSLPTVPYSENSIEAINYALSYPEISGVEIDIQWSKDGTAWLFHDSDLGSLTNGSGCVRSKTDAELETYHYKGLQQEKVPKLNDIAPLVANRKVMLDLKNYVGCGEALTDLEIQNSLAEFNSLLENTEVYVVVQQFSDLAFYTNLGWKTILEVYDMNSYYAVPGWENSAGCCTQNKSISSTEVRDVQSHGKEVVLYNIKSPKSIRESLKKGPNIILADDIKATLIQKIR